MNENTVRTCLCPCNLHSKYPRPLFEKTEKPPATVTLLPTDVRLYLDAERIGASNVPFYSRQHECTGRHITAWGYYGTGPHCLASDILQWFGLSKKEADHWSTELVIEFLGFIPKKGAVIPRERIQRVISGIKSGKRKHWREAGEDVCKRSRQHRDEFLAKGGF